MNFQNRVIKTLIIGLLTSSSLLWGRFYMGIKGGFLKSVSEFKYTTTGSIPLGKSGKSSITEHGGMANFVLGIENFFGEAQASGARLGIYGGYGYTKGGNKDFGATSMGILSAGVFLDKIYNAIQNENFQFGIFGGVGYNFSRLRPKKEIKLGFKATPPILEEDSFISNRCDVHALLIRVGLTTLVSKHHRFELIGQVPADFVFQMASLNYSNSIGSINANYTFSFERIQGLLSYKRVF